MTENYEPTSDEVVDELSGPSAPAPDSWIARVLLVVAARERLIKRHNLATDGTIPAPKPVRETFRVELSEYDRNLLRSIAQSPTVVPLPTTRPWSPNPIVYSGSDTQANSTFDHQGERP